MVRFKNRWLLVEFFQPDQHCPPSSSKLSDPTDLPIFELTGQHDLTGGDQTVVELDDEDEDQDDRNYPSSSTIPFLAPTQPIFLTSAAQRLAAGLSRNPNIGQGGTPGKLIPEKQIFHSLRRTIVDVFGDSGWGKVANSLSVKYFSQTTSLCIIRVARDHYRTVWGGLTFMNELENIRVIPRVIGCSGTLKKLYGRAESYTTLLIAQYLSYTLAYLPTSKPSAEVGTPDAATASSIPVNTAITREAKVRTGEIEAWRERRTEVIKALRAVDEG